MVTPLAPGHRAITTVDSLTSYLYRQIDNHVYARCCLFELPVEIQHDKGVIDVPTTVPLVGTVRAPAAVHFRTHRRTHELYPHISQP